MKVYKLSPSEEALNAMISIMDKELEKCRPFYFPTGIVMIQPNELVEKFAYFLISEKGSIIPKMLNQ